MGTQTNKGFIKDAWGNKLLPITRAELVLDEDGNIALNSEHFLAGGNNPIGLITASERAMLTGNAGTGGGITDIYNKLGYINEGLKVGETTIPFYDEDGATPIHLIGNKGQIAIYVGENNTLGISLDPLYTDKEGNLAPSVENSILRGITVDNFGRVIAVEGGGLTSTDIPDLLENKELKGCITKSVDSDNSIVNKLYVDTKIKDITGVATGALRFGGSITSADLKDENNNDKTTQFLKNINHYYKATESFTISGIHNSESTQDTNIDINVKVGDTLIINDKEKFVHVPSGDDITAITVTGINKDSEGNETTITAINKQVGQIALEFGEIFTLSGQNNNGINTATIGLNQVSSTSDGYLTSTDYNAFKSLKGVSYTQANTVQSYEIGTITIGDTATTIHGKDTTYSIGLIKSKVDGEETTINPILQFKDSSSASTDITYKGVNGINVNYGNVDNEIIFSPNFTIDDDSKAYLSFNNGTFKVKKGQLITNDDGTTVQDGVTPYTEFNALVSAVAYATEKLTETLVRPETWKDDDDDNGTLYKYGSKKLKTAITIAI